MIKKNLFLHYVLRLSLSFIIITLLLLSLYLSLDKTTIGSSIKLANRISINSWKFIIITGFFSTGFATFAFKKKIFRSSSLILTGFWIISSAFLLVFVLLPLSKLKKDRVNIEKSNVLSATDPEQKLKQQSCNKQETINDLKNCTFVIIKDDNTHNTGFAITAKYGLTTRTAVENTKYLYTWAYKKKHNLTVAGYSKDYDLAIIQIPFKINPCQWSKEEMVEKKQDVFMISWPDKPIGISTITEGKIINSVSTEEKVTFLQTNFTVVQGNQGAPIADQCGVKGIFIGSGAWPKELAIEQNSGLALPAIFTQPIASELTKSAKEIKLPITKITPKLFHPEKEATLSAVNN